MIRIPALLAAASLTLMSHASADHHEGDAPTPLDHTVESLEGKQVDLSEYKGKVVLIVNTASKCGATPQYGPLEALYEKHKDEGLVVVGFPCNQFGSQEPGTAEDIAEFCEKNYGVSFPMMAKVDVNGPDASPVYKELTEFDKDPGAVRWNFEKFLVGKDGNVVARFRTQTKPDSEEVVSAIQSELKK